MTIPYGLGQNLNVFLTGLGNRAPELVSRYAQIGAVVYVCLVVHVVRKQIKGRKFLYGATALVTCVFVNPVWFLPYGEYYQTVFLLLIVPFALVELRWRKLLTIGDLALFHVPLWHWSLVYWFGWLNEA